MRIIAILAVATAAINLLLAIDSGVFSSIAGWGSATAGWLTAVLWVE